MPDSAGIAAEKKNWNKTLKMARDFVEGRFFCIFVKTATILL